MAKSLSMRDPLPPVQSDECEIVVIDKESTAKELQSAVERIRCVFVFCSTHRRFYDRCRSAHGPPWYADSRRPVACTSIKPVLKGGGKSIVSFLVSKEEWIERKFQLLYSIQVDLSAISVLCLPDARADTMQELETR